MNQNLKQGISQTFCSKFANYLKLLQLATLEMNITDYSFYIFLNLGVYQKFSEQFSLKRILSFVASLYILARSTLMYLNLALNSNDVCETELSVRPSPKKFTDLEKEILLEGINRKMTLSSMKKVRFINLYFRMQLSILPVFIITCQNMKTPLCISIIVIEIATTAYYLKLKKQLRCSIFSSWVDFLSYMTITWILLIISILGLYTTEWHTNEYAKTRRLNLSGKYLDENLIRIILGLIGLSILLEFLKGLQSVFSPCRTKQRKKKKRTQVDQGKDSLVLLDSIRKMKNTDSILSRKIRNIRIISRITAFGENKKKQSKLKNYYKSKGNNIKNTTFRIKINRKQMHLRKSTELNTLGSDRLLLKRSQNKIQLKLNAKQDTDTKAKSVRRFRQSELQSKQKKGFLDFPNPYKFTLKRCESSRVRRKVKFKGRQDFNRLKFRQTRET